jgi:hypothetical protein
MPDIDDALSVALDLARALRDAEIPYAIGGALAYSMWAIPRATLDVDINVFVDVDGIPRLAACLASLGIDADPERFAREHESSGLLIVRWRGLRVDLFTPSIPFSREAEATRVAIAVGEEAFFFLSREALAVFKLLFFRPKDLADLAQLVATNGPRMDLEYVRNWIVEMMGADDERVARWDRIVSSGGREI